ncbi:hypothetical protein [Parafrankia sp. FMc2]|uniref:hypothetical protein n=1 Tax=Parafrankia sp. FMc2 TaxID=3233196 RepID=UPI0034D7542B
MTGGTGRGVLDDLRALPWWATGVLVLLASVVLALRIVGLIVATIVDAAERADIAATSAAGIGPLAASVWLVPTGFPRGGEHR